MSNSESYHSLFNVRTKMFYAGNGWTSTPSAVYRYSQERANEVLLKLDDDNVKIIPYKTVFKIIGIPGNNNNSKRYR